MYSTLCINFLDVYGAHTRLPAARLPGFPHNLGIFFATEAVLPDGRFSNQKYQFGQILEGLAMAFFSDHRVCFTTIRHILPVLVCSPMTKSGNPERKKVSRRGQCAAKRKVTGSRLAVGDNSHSQRSVIEKKEDILEKLV
jgi:hypothetical protein